MKICYSMVIINHKSIRGKRIYMKNSNINTDSMNVNSYRKKSTKSTSIRIISPNTTRKNKLCIDNDNNTISDNNDIPNFDSLSQYIGLLVLAAKGFNVTNNNINTNKMNNNTNNITTLTIKPKDNAKNMAIRLLNQSPLVINRFSLNEAGILKN